jgi:hypothetical protein
MFAKVAGLKQLFCFFASIASSAAREKVTSGCHDSQRQRTTPTVSCFQMIREASEASLPRRICSWTPSVMPCFEKSMAL